MRYIFIALFTLLLPVQAWACSCSPWKGGYVSDFVKSYDSVWAVPIEAKMVPRRGDRPGTEVEYTLSVLEGYDRIIRQRILVRSNVMDGGSCGVQLTIGAPQFISFYKRPRGRYLSSCTSYPLPYEAIELYLTTGKDLFVPSPNDCYVERDGRWSVDAEKIECQVYIGSTEDPSQYEREDRLKYWRLMREQEADRDGD